MASVFLRGIAAGLALALASCAAVVAFDRYDTEPPAVLARAADGGDGAAPATPLSGGSDAQQLERAPVIIRGPQNTLVILHDAAGALISNGVLPQTGMASTTLPVAFVTLGAEYTEASTWLITYAGVEPGDTLTFGTPIAGNPVRLGHVVVDLPTAPGAQTYSLGIFGGNNYSTGWPAASADSPTGIGLDLFADEVDADGTFTLVAWATAPCCKSPPFAFISKVVRFGPGLSVVLDEPWAAPVKQGVEFAQGGGESWGIWALAGERRVFLGFPDVVQLPAGIADTLLVNGFFGTSSTAASTRVQRKAPFDGSVVHIDMSVEPTVSASIDTHDPAHTTLSWSSDAPESFAATVELQAHNHSTSWPLDFRWTFLEPPGATTQRLLDLPTGLMPSWMRGLDAAAPKPTFHVEVLDSEAGLTFADFKRLARPLVDGRYDDPRQSVFPAEGAIPMGMVRWLIFDSTRVH